MNFLKNYFDWIFGIIPLIGLPLLFFGCSDGSERQSAKAIDHLEDTTRIGGICGEDSSVAFTSPREAKQKGVVFHKLMGGSYRLYAIGDVLRLSSNGRAIRPDDYALYKASDSSGSDLRLHKAKCFSVFLEDCERNLKREIKVRYSTRDQQIKWTNILKGSDSKGEWETVTFRFDNLGLSVGEPYRLDVTH